jgi:hypothetical protein
MAHLNSSQILSHCHRYCIVFFMNICLYLYWLLVDMNEIRLYLVLMPLAMWSVLSSLKCTQKLQALNLCHLSAGRDNQYCTMFCEPRLSVSGTDSMKFLMVSAAYL